MPRPSISKYSSTCLAIFLIFEYENHVNHQILPLNDFFAGLNLLGVFPEANVSNARRRSLARFSGSAEVLRPSSFRLDLHLPEGGSTHTPATQQMAWLAVPRGYNFDPLGLFFMKSIENNY